MLEANQSLDAALSASTLGGVLSYFPSSHGPTVNEGASHRLGSNKPKKKKKKLSLLLTSVNILLQLKLISPWKMWLKEIRLLN